MPLEHEISPIFLYNSKVLYTERVGDREGDEEEASGGESRGLGAEYKKGKVAGKSKRTMIRVGHGRVGNLFKWKCASFNTEKSR